MKKYLLPLPLALLISVSYPVFVLAEGEPGFTEEAAPAQVPAPSSAEFDLNLKGLGSTSALQSFAEEWQNARLAEGKEYRVSVGRAQINAKPGTNDYVDAYDLAVQEATLNAHALHISEFAANNVSEKLGANRFDRKGFAEVDAEKDCQQSNANKLNAKLAAIANGLAEKAIEYLGGDNDPSTNFSESVHCRYENLVAEVSRDIMTSTIEAIRGARMLKLEIDGPTVAVAIAYGQPGIELANVVKLQKPSDNPIPQARSEIFAWVEKNILSTREILPSSGIRSFKLSNGEWAVVSVGLASIPHQGGMSDHALALRTDDALKKADLRATGALLSFSGASVKKSSSEDASSRYAELLDVEIQDGVATAKIDEAKVASIFREEISSIARGQLRGIIQVKSGGRESDIAEGKVAYTIRAWSPSLLASARAFESMNRPQPVRSSAPQGSDPASKRASSPTMQEDW